jgi:hypothetical protein
LLNYNYPEFKGFEGDEDQLKQHIKKIVEKLYPASQPLVTETSPTWTVRIKCKQYEVDRSFTVPITIDRDEAGHSLLVGSGDFFVNSNREGCANCREQTETGLETQAFVHLDAAFASIGLSEVPDERKVEHLKKNLHWRVEKVNNDYFSYFLSSELTIVSTKVDHEAARLPSLEIMVMKHAVQLRHGHLPTVGGPTYFPEITQGREG